MQVVYDFYIQMQPVRNNSKLYISITSNRPFIEPITMELNNLQLNWHKNTITYTSKYTVRSIYALYLCHFKRISFSFNHMDNALLNKPIQFTQCICRRL